MSETFVEDHLRRLTVRWMIVYLAGLAFVALALILSAGYIYNLFFGPFAVESSAVQALTPDTLPAQYYVTVRGKSHYDTGYTRVSTENGVDTTEAYYYVLTLGDKLLLVESPTDDVRSTMTGALTRIDSETQSNVVDALLKEEPNLAGAFLPVMLDANDFRRPGYIGLGLAALASLAFLAGFGVNLFRFFSPASQPAMRALERYGAQEQIAAAIDGELAVPHTVIGKGIHFSEHWLASTRRSLGGFDAARYADILWAYKHVQRSTYMLITVSKTFSAMVWDRTGKLITLQAKEKDVDQALAEIARRAPGAVIGYTPQLLNLWRKDRAQFAALVDRRRANPNP